MHDIGTREWLRHCTDDDIKGALRYELSRALDPDGQQVPAYCNAARSEDSPARWSVVMSKDGQLTNDFMNMLWAHGIWMSALRDGLTARAKEACLLWLNEGMTYEEIGKELKRHRNTIGTDIRQAFKTMVELVKLDCA